MVGPRSLGTCEWMIKVVESMYDGVATAIKVNGEASSDFEVKVAYIKDLY